MYDIYNTVLRRVLKHTKLEYVGLDYKGDIIFNNTNNPVITQGAIFDLSGFVYLEKNLKLIDKFIDYISITKYEIINDRKCIHTQHVRDFKEYIS